MEALCLRPPPVPRFRFPSPPLIPGSIQHTRAQPGRVGAPSGVNKTRSSYMAPLQPVRRLWPRQQEQGRQEIGGEEGVAEEVEVVIGGRRRRRSWVLNILRVGSIWEREKGNRSGGNGEGEEEEVERRMLEGGDRCVGSCDGEIVEGCEVDWEEGEEVEFDRDSFSRLLRRASLAEAKLYAKLSYLGSLAYSIPKIQTGNLFKYHGLHFVTSSVVKRSRSSSTEAEQSIVQKKTTKKEETFEPDSIRPRIRITPSAAYKIAASAASYVQYQTKTILPFGAAKKGDGTDSPKQGIEDNNEYDCKSREMASFVATTDSVTAMVAAKEEAKDAVAKDLNSARSSPCEWFICDDERSKTRLFVIQGSDSLAAWQANLLFEPITFEKIDVLVHRGIYEAAKGIYEQILPEVRSHLETHGKSATLRFTGHSLGGSLALLLNLMLLIRGEALASSLLPVITYGAPSIMCGGNYLLRVLGLPLSHVQSIILHRDIVPRAFSCTYPDQVAEILKAVNGNFRTLPCLRHQKLLYAPMGELLILQPDEKFSPHHELLPPGSGLYILGRSVSNDSKRHMRAAVSVFLNSPHPLEILSDRSAYGSEGAIYRDHDMKSYMRSFQSVIRAELKLLRKAKREYRHHLWWPLVCAEGADANAAAIRKPRLRSSGLWQINFPGVLRGGRESLRRFARLVTSQQVHLLVVLLLPARQLLLEAVAVVPFV